VLWFTLWFMVILKIPVLYLAFVIWWAVKDPPQPGGDAPVDELGGDGPGRRPGGRRRPHSGPHGSPTRRPAPARAARPATAPRR
jgi:hypothetical protein